MNQLKLLAGQTAIYGMGTIIPRLLNYLLLTPFYTRIFIQGEYGIFTELYAYAAFLFVVLTFGMETTFFRYAEKEQDKNKVYSTVLSSLFFTSSLFILLAVLFVQPIASFIQYQQNTEYIIYFAFIIGIDAFISIPFAKLRQENKALKFAIIKIINVVVNIGFNFFFLWLCPKILASNPESVLGHFYNPEIGVGYAFISNLIATLTSLILLLPDIFKISYRFDLHLLKKMLNYALPLLVVGIAGMVNEVFDKLLFKFLITVPDGVPDGKEYIMSQLGIYGANYKLAVLMTLFIQMFRYAAEPFFFSHAKDKNSKTLYALVMKYFVIFCLIIFLMVMLFIDVFKLYIGADFREGLHIVPIILFANLLLGVFYNLSLWYKLNDLTRYGALIAIIGASVTLALNFMLVPRYGYFGAAWAHFFCYFVMVIISFFLGRRFYPIPYDFKRIGLYFMTAILIYILNIALPVDLGPVRFAIGTISFLIFLVIVFFTEKPLYKANFQ